MAVYFGLKAIAKRMGVSVSTIRRWHKKRGFPMVKVLIKKVKDKWIVIPKLEMEDGEGRPDQLRIDGHHDYPTRMARKTNNAARKRKNIKKGKI